MCAKQLHPLINNGLIAKYGILEVSQFRIHTLLSGHKLSILFGCEAACPNPGSTIGIPVNVDMFERGGGEGGTWRRMYATAA